MFVDAGTASAPRLGLAISKRTAPTAVLRNLAKRIARESARAARGLTLADYVVRSRAALGPDWRQAKQSKTTSAYKRALRQELDGLFARACTQKEVRVTPVLDVIKYPFIHKACFIYYCKQRLAL